MYRYTPALIAVALAAFATVAIAQNQKGENEQAQQQQQTLSTYYKSYAACMEGRGYTVK